MSKLFRVLLSILVLGLLSLSFPAASVYAKRHHSASSSTQIENVVYITRTGHKFHRAGCRYLKYSHTEIDWDEAIRLGYEPCKVCRP